MHVNCPGCATRLRTPDARTALHIRCPKCARVFQICTPPVGAPSVTANPVATARQAEPADEGPGIVAKSAFFAVGLICVVVLVYLGHLVWGTTTRTEAPPQETAGVPGTQPHVPPLPATPATDPAAASPAPERPATPSVVLPAADPRRAPAMVPVKPTEPTIAPAGRQHSVEPSPPKTLTPEELFAKASPAVVRVVVRDKDFKPIGQGSGFFISADGLVVTNYHVIKDAEFASVLLHNGATFFVEGVAAMKPERDLALLKVKGAALPFLALPTGRHPKVGARVYAIGNPAGLTNTLSEGLVSGVRNEGGNSVLLQTTAAISRGSSGGPLLTADGAVAGVTTAYLAGGQNLNFAVPAADVSDLLRAQGKLRTLASAGGAPLDKAETAELDKAWEAIGKRDWTTATVILVGLRKSQPNNPFVWFALGYLHESLSNHDIAIAHFKQANILKPDFAEAYYFMGLSHSAMKWAADAVAAFKQAIALRPGYADAYYFMGVAYGDMKRYREAVAAYEQAIALDPDYAEAGYRSMAATYRLMNRHTEAAAADKQVAVLRRLRQNLPKLEFSGIPVGDVIQFLRDVSSTNIVVNWGALQAVGIDKTSPVNIKLTNVTFRQALRSILVDVGGLTPLDFAVRDGLIIISTRADLSQRAPGGPG